MPEKRRALEAHGVTVTVWRKGAEVPAVEVPEWAGPDSFNAEKPTPTERRMSELAARTGGHVDDARRGSLVPGPLRITFRGKPSRVTRARRHDPSLTRSNDVRGLCFDVVGAVALRTRVVRVGGSEGVREREGAEGHPAEAAAAEPEPQTRPATKPGEPTAQRSLTASGAMQFVSEVSQNPSVVAAVGAATGVTVHKVLNRPPKPPEPPKAQVILPSDVNVEK